MGKIELDGSFRIILCVKTAKTNKYHIIVAVEEFFADAGSGQGSQSE